MNKNDFTISDIRSENIKLPFYFLSDNHISTRKDPEQSKRMSDMLTLLDEILKSKGTLFILGDFFDFWFDKNHYVPSELSPIVEALKKLLDEGIEIHYVGGNHDYWIEGYLTNELGIRFYPDALRFEWEGKRFYCQHGDHIVYVGEQYPWVRKVLRDPLSIGLLKLLPIKWTYKLGEQVSHYNRNVPDIPRVSDLLVLKMKNYLEQKLKDGYDVALTGHVHEPYLHAGDNGTLVILGDWIHNRSYAYMDEHGLKLIQLKK